MGVLATTLDGALLSAYEAQRLIQRRVQGFEESGMTILQTHEGLPLYTNMIRGLIDKFINRNPQVNLLHMWPHMAAPSQEPCLFPHLYMQDQVNFESSDELYDTSPYFPTHRTQIPINTLRRELTKSHKPFT